MDKIKGVQPSTVSGWMVLASSIMLTIGPNKVSELPSLIMNMTIEQAFSLAVSLFVGIYNIVRDEYKHSGRDEGRIVLPTIYKRED